MSIFESGVRDDRRAVGARVGSGAGEIGVERIRRPLDRAGRAAIARDRGTGAIGQLLVAISRLVFPVLLLITVAAAALIYGSEPVPWLGNLDVGGAPFGTGRLALLATLFVVQLTNRRYGAAYASAQLLGAMLVAIGALFYLGDDLALLRGGAPPNLRLALAFAGALVVAQFVSIFVFDRLRGPRWWQAPLFGVLFGGVVLALLAYPAAYAGTGVSWSGPMMAYMAIVAAASVVLLVPYWLLRGLIAPLSGFGGY